MTRLKMTSKPGLDGLASTICDDNSFHLVSRGRKTVVVVKNTKKDKAKTRRIPDRASVAEYPEVARFRDRCQLHVLGFVKFRYRKDAQEATRGAQNGLTVGGAESRSSLQIASILPELRSVKCGARGGPEKIQIATWCQKSQELIFSHAGAMLVKIYWV
ncbi:hypothetical protein RRG08_064138 [Elysia crispata]|uniref:Uncharacterized protein n=1 Tax=Elysia crispata TaxID=231223 RepID=A0AAE1DIE6_9GAST|nr:hypothetical protein RRG08_064138 [Elysia crispata]